MYDLLHLPNTNSVKSEILADLERCEGLNWNPYSPKKNLVLRAHDIRLKLNLPLILKLEMTALSPIPPWDRSKLNINSDLIIKAKNTLSDLVLIALFGIMVRTKFPNFIQVYTGGSKTEEGDDAFVGAAFHIPSLQAQKDGN